MDRKKRAALDLAEKLRLEEELTLVLTRLFNRVADEFSQSVEVTGMPPAMDNWQSFFEDALASHYQVTGDIFKHRIQDQLDLEITEEEEGEINAALALYFTNEARESAEIINRTNREQAGEAMQRAAAQEQADRQADGTRYSPAVRASVATNIFRVLLFGRVTSIATTETNKPAEAAKFTEMEVINYRKPSVNNPSARPLPGDLKDEWAWTGILDEAIRDTHLAADGQKQQVGTPFKVGHSLLLFPGDRSLGAPLKEIINCRCCAIGIPNRRALRERKRKMLVS